MISTNNGDKDRPLRWDREHRRSSTDASMLVVKPSGCCAFGGVLRILSQPMRTLQEITHNRSSCGSDDYRCITTLARENQERGWYITKTRKVALTLAQDMLYLSHTRTEACSTYQSLRSSDPNTSGRQKSVLIDSSGG